MPLFFMDPRRFIKRDLRFLNSFYSCQEMKARDVTKERRAIEKALLSDSLDFSGAYLTICDLRDLVQTHPHILRSETVQGLRGLLTNMRFADQTQSFFLYREAADALASIIVRNAPGPLARQAVAALRSVLGKAVGHAQRAAAHALGSLPLAIQGPEMPAEALEDIPQASWQDIVREHGVVDPDSSVRFGRSLAFSADGQGALLVFKLVRAEHSLQHAHQEVAWMEHFHSEGYSFPVRFNVPVPIRVRGSYVFKLRNVRLRIPETADLHPEGYAIGFIADKDYFNYPNEHQAEKRLTGEAFREVVFRNAWLLGRLTSLGIAHSAAVPLFHNRVQRNRRADRGLYEWPRGGRLDRWLESCRHPNVGLTGIRDFEHLISLNGSGRKLYHLVGSQILSLLLLTGSYFRHKDIGRIGLDERGHPIDARALFDELFLRELVDGIFLRYYEGFVGTQFSGEVPLDTSALAFRMIEEMGVDRHMEEVLRVADQKEMSEEEFRRFLAARGHPESEAEGLRRGMEDITVHTGPHLGGFNERISLPELVESVGTISALCIAGSYCVGSGLHI